MQRPPPNEGDLKFYLHESNTTNSNPLEVSFVTFHYCYTYPVVSHVCHRLQASRPHSVRYIPIQSIAQLSDGIVTMNHSTFQIGRFQSEMRHSTSAYMICRRSLVTACLPRVTGRDSPTSTKPRPLFNFRANGHFSICY